MARRKNIAGSADSGDQSLLLYTTLMLILVSFFIVLLTKANFDETRYASAVSSIHNSFGFFNGGRVAIGVNEGLPDFSLGFDQGGRLTVPDMEMAQIRALLAPAILSREARVIHTRNQRIISLSAGLVFNLDSTEINEKTAETLSAFAQIMADNEVTIAVEGHTDSHPPQTRDIGDNWDISSRRALAVMEYLSGPGGLDPKRLAAFGYGGSKPLRSNMTPAGRAANNRVDLVLDFSRVRNKNLKDLADQPTSIEFQGFDFLLRSGPQEESR